MTAAKLRLGLAVCAGLTLATVHVQAPAEAQVQGSNPTSRPPAYGAPSPIQPRRSFAATDRLGQQGIRFRAPDRGGRYGYSDPYRSRRPDCARAHNLSRYGHRACGCGGGHRHGR